MLLHLDDKCVERLIDFLENKKKIDKETLKATIEQFRQKIADSRRSQKARITRMRNENLT